MVWCKQHPGNGCPSCRKPIVMTPTTLDEKKQQFREDAATLRGIVKNSSSRKYFFYLSSS
jgi:hypothetical protein